MNKIFAISFGAAGITLLAHFQNLMALLTLLPAEGVSKGIIIHLPKGDQRNQSGLVITGILVALAIYAVSFGIIFIGRSWFFGPFNLDISGTQFYVLLFFGSALILTNAILLTVWQANLLFKNYALNTLAFFAFTTIAALWASTFNNLDWALITYCLGQASVILVTLTYLISKKLIITSSLNLVKANLFAKYLIMAGSSVLAGKLVSFLARDYSISQFGLETTGLWQAQVKFSDAIALVFMGAFGAVFLPTITRLLPNRADLRTYFLKTSVFIVSISGFGLVLIFLAKEWLFNTFYDSTFSGASTFYGYQLWSDWLYIVSALFGMVLLAHVKTLKFVVSQLFSGLVYLIAIWFFTQILGLTIEGMPLANFIRYMLYLIIVIVFAYPLLKSSK